MTPPSTRPRYGRRALSTSEPRGAVLIWWGGRNDRRNCQWWTVGISVAAAHRGCDGLGVGTYGRGLPGAGGTGTGQADQARAQTQRLAAPGSLTHPAASLQWRKQRLAPARARSAPAGSPPNLPSSVSAAPISTGSAHSPGTVKATGCKDETPGRCGGVHAMSSNVSSTPPPPGHETSSPGRVWPCPLRRQRSRRCRRSGWSRWRRNVALPVCGGTVRLRSRC
jgi:hypothetical protein